MGRHRMHPNSLDCFEEIEDQRSDRADAVYRTLLDGGPMTDREIMTALGFTDPNAVRPRVTELRDMRWVVEAGAVECPVSRKRVRLVRALTTAERDSLIAGQRAEWALRRQQSLEAEAAERRRRAPGQQLSFAI